MRVLKWLNHYYFPLHMKYFRMLQMTQYIDHFIHMMLFIFSRYFHPCVNIIHAGRMSKIHLLLPSSELLQ